MGHKPPKKFKSTFEIPEMPLPDLAAGNPESHEGNWCWRHWSNRRYRSHGRQWTYWPHGSDRGRSYWKHRG